MSFKRLFTGKNVVEYSARRSMIETPPPGHVTDRHGKYSSTIMIMMVGNSGPDHLLFRGGSLKCF